MINFSAHIREFDGLVKWMGENKEVYGIQGCVVWDVFSRYAAANMKINCSLHHVPIPDLGL